uniref:Uncharacterized protein n=1 Tax=Candidatus Kentrum sp. MB TaxID=2138164 RepID=A0A451BBM8_9GAMM|nr:MAG: hypothetical protein BECKMB1821I_GA0114274_10291 [Candidatus Kentron sp. MB]VFK75682.1 MAG: hypothetical protein BECKMB1821H_GA0114242_102847 [Candidatus Kentron sp. MB]
MLHFLHRYQPGWIQGLCLCFLALFSSPNLAVCTHDDLNMWWQGNGWKPGAAIWAGADNIPIYARPDKGAATGEYLPFNSPSLPIKRS